MTNLPVELIIGILHNVDLITLLRCQQVSTYVAQDLQSSLFNAQPSYPGLTTYD